VSPARLHRSPRRFQKPAGLNFTLHMRRLCTDMVHRVDDLGHIDMSRVAVSFSQARTSTDYGMFAALTPMRFPGGKRHAIRRGEKWGIQRLEGPHGLEMLYILHFYLPRFLDIASVREKLLTVLHELWHIGPKFDGDSRRFRGRCHAHSASEVNYDARVEILLAHYLAAEPPESIYSFLRLNFQELITRFGRVIGEKIPAPKLFRVA
jgi:predicted metallopeptidase